MVMKKFKKSRIILLVLILIVISLIIAETQTRFIRRWISDVIYDNRVPYLHCENLLNLAEVEQTVAAHQDLIEQIEAVHPGFIRVTISSSVNRSDCPGKGYLVIEYASHADRLQIEAIIGETFFGIPWMGLNL